ncbi:hypothetical protein ACROYT_G016626 [Oculina patagonica]
MDALLKLPSLGSTADVRKFRQTNDEIEAHVRGLQALKVPTESYGRFLVPVLMTKIPEDIRLLVGREMKDGKWNLSAILQILRREIENRERYGGVQAFTAKEEFYSPENRRNAKPPKSDLPSAAALFAEKQPASTPSCTFCKQRHPTASCHVVTNRAARRECLKKQGRCFICLRKGHLAKDCPSDITCFKCSARHHVSCQPKEKSSTDALLQRLWDLDLIGIREQATVHETFLENISFESGRYCVKLPLKENRDLLPDNYDLSLARLNSVVRRLRKEPSVIKEYDQTFRDQLQSGIVERVEEAEKSCWVRRTICPIKLSLEATP